MLAHAALQRQQPASLAAAGVACLAGAGGVASPVNPGLD